MRTIVICAVWLAASATAAAAQSPRPVMIGSGGPDAAACSSIAEVRGLSRRGDNYLSVRAGPSVRARELARLGSGRRVHVCDSTADGQWTGIVYGRDRNQDCGVSEPISRPQPYRAGWVCRSGWVSTRYIIIVG